MKCYYEELFVERDANESEIKSAYRKLALKWHPDKNPDSIEAAKERFQLIQQAYEVLSDPQERAWYDNHREQILRGKNSDYEDKCLDVFQYFTSSCFNGYGDDDKGFYAIYREVFEKISAEDAEFMDYEDEWINTPKFGDSKSSYEEVVGPFYAHWSAYCTKRTYTWLCPYDIKEVKDRRILREIEKNMKKVVQKAKKERNEEVRNLVSFVRKRDKRVQAYKRLLEERSALNRQKQKQNRLEQIRRRQQELEEMKQNGQGASDNDYEEQLKHLEQQYSSGDECYDNEDNLAEHENLGDEKYIDELYCVACNKQFKTGKSFENHEISRKHRDNIERLMIDMQDEENSYQQGNNFLDAEETQIQELEKANEIKNLQDTINQTISTKNKSSKTKHKKDVKDMKQLYQLNLNAEDINDENAEEIVEKLDTMCDIDKDDEGWNTTSKKISRKCKNKNRVGKNKSSLFEQDSCQAQIESEAISKTDSKLNCVLKSEITLHICATCKSEFESKNKLFSHLKLTNHGVFIPKTKTKDDVKCKKVKGKK